MKQIILNINDDLHMDFKLACVRENKTMSEVILAWIQNKLKQEEMTTKIKWKGGEK